MENCKLEEIIDRYRGHYVLPGLENGSVQIVPVSGGADSSALAILLSKLFPEVKFKYIMTDTEAEEELLYDSLEALEGYLGQPIEKVTGGKSLYELIEDQGGFLPSPRDRWCTRKTKLIPFQDWIAQFKGRPKVMYSGIRADESSRLAFTLDEVQTEMPFIDLGIHREIVYRILQESIGIPKFYSRRSRSGCECCPFQQRSERVGLFQEKPLNFYRAGSYEKLGPKDQGRYQLPPTLNDEIGRLGWMTLPMPRSGVIDGKLKRTKSGSLFGMAGIFVGAEFFFDGMYFTDEFIWRQGIVSYSPTLSGIKKQLDGRFKHLLSTYEVMDIHSEEELRRSLKFAIYYLECPSTLFDPAGPIDPGTYTWHQGESYAQLSHVTAWTRRILHHAGMMQMQGIYSKANPASWAGEQAEILASADEKIKFETGSLVIDQWYSPKEPPEIDPDQFDETKVACPMCSV